MTQKKKSKKPGWKHIEKNISKFDNARLIQMLRDLYHLSPENKAFFFTRFSIGKDPLASYRRIIQNAMNPYLEDGETLEVEAGGDAIDRFEKAVNNPHAEAELRILYVECGTNFMLSYGYTDEDLSEDILEMYHHAVETVLKLPLEQRDNLKTGLYEIMESAKALGWWYYDALGDLYHEAFPDDSPREH